MRTRLFGVFLLTLVFLALALRGADPQGAWEALSSFAWWRIPVVLALYAGVLVSRTQRFRRLVRTPVAFGQMLPVMAASFLAINVVPLRMGELVRPYLLASRGVPFGEAIAAVVIERVLDMLALLVLVALAVALVEPPNVMVGGVDVLALGRRAVASGIAALVVGIGLLRLVGAAAVERAAGSLANGRAAKLFELLRRVDEGFRALLRPRPGDAAVLFYTVASWCGSIAACGVAMGGFAGLSSTLGTVLLNWAATLSAIVLLPTPGFVGAFEAGSVASLVALGNDADAARMFAVLLHVAQFAFTAVAGLIGFAVLGSSLGRAVRESRSGR